MFFAGGERETGMRALLFTALALAVATPASAAIIFQQTVTASGGFAELYDAAPVSVPQTMWVGVDTGQITSAFWEVYGSETILWWDPMGAGFDMDGNPIPAITGNDYFYIPGCMSTTGAPTCGGGPVQTLLKDNVVRAIFLPPHDSNNCSQVFTGNTANCAFFYSFQGPDYDIIAAAPDGGVTFTFYDSNPLAGGVPEPASWTMLIAGFGLAGAALRRSRKNTAYGRSRVGAGSGDRTRITSLEG